MMKISRMSSNATLLSTVVRRVMTKGFTVTVTTLAVIAALHFRPTKPPPLLIAASRDSRPTTQRRGSENVSKNMVVAYGNCDFYRASYIAHLKSILFNSLWNYNSYVDHANITSGFRLN